MSKLPIYPSDDLYIQHIKEEEFNRTNEFRKKVKKDMGSDIDELIVFIESLLKQNSDDMTVHTNDGNTYSINYCENSSMKNRRVGMPISANSTNKEPSNFSIDISREKINMHVYYDKKDNYLHTDFVVSEDLVYDKLEKLLYDHYVKTKKNEISFCIEDLYMVSKLDRQRKIKKFLNEDKN